MVPAAVATTLFSKPRCPYEDTARGVPLVLSFQPNPQGGVVYTDTTASSTSRTWTDVDIGAPHPDRIVVVYAYGGATTGTVSVTVNGNREFINHPNNSASFMVAPVRMPGTVRVPATSDKASITLSVSAGSSRKAIAVYAIYPKYPLPLDEDIAFDGTTATVSNMEMSDGGCLIWGGGIAALTTTTLTWANGGGESLSTDVNNLQPFSPTAVTLSAGNILARVSNPDGDLSMTAGAGGTRRLCVITFGPPVRYL